MAATGRAPGCDTPSSGAATPALRIPLGAPCAPRGAPGRAVGGSRPPEERTAELRSRVRVGRPQLLTNPGLSHGCGGERCGSDSPPPLAEPESPDGASAGAAWGRKTGGDRRGTPPCSRGWERRFAEL